MYKFYNANYKGRFVNDCTIRAISLAEGKTWQETHRELSYLSGKDAIILDDVYFIEPLLDSRYNRVNCRHMTVGQFANRHSKGIYLLLMNGHITCCIDGVVYDTFNCLHKKLNIAYKVSN